MNYPEIGQPARDHLITADERIRTTMENASQRLLDALWREHPSIMQALRAQR